MINNVTIFATSSLVNTPNRNHINLFFYYILHILSIASLAACNLRLTPPASEALPHEADRIQPCPPNPFYWQYKGPPSYCWAAALRMISSKSPLSPRICTCCKRSAAATSAAPCPAAIGGGSSVDSALTGYTAKRVGESATIASDGSLQLVAPADTGYWAAVIKVVE